MKMLTILYLASGLYALYFCGSLVAWLCKNKSVDGKLVAKMTKKYTVAILLVCLVASPIRLWYGINEVIPEGTYVVKGVLKINGDDNEYSVPVDLAYYTDIEYTENEKHDYLFDGGISWHAEFKERFLLLDVTPPKNVNIDGFEFEGFASLPETVESAEDYEIEICGTFIDGYDRHGRPIIATGGKYCILSIPPLTKENLGITPEDQMRAAGAVTYIEHCVCFAAAAFSLLIIRKFRKD